LSFVFRYLPYHSFESKGKLFFTTMTYNSGSGGESGNVWSSGSRGGSRGGYSRSNDDDDDGPRGGGSYGGSYGNNNSRRGGGGYGFRRERNDGEVEILNDAVFIQNLPRNVTRDEIMDAFSTVGTIKTDDRSGGPKIWLYKDRDTGEGNGRATVTYEDNESANKAISKFNDQQIESLGVVVRVQLAQRRPRNNDNNDRGGRGGYRGGRNNWDNYQSRPGFNSGGRWSNTGGDFADNRNGGGFRGTGGGSDSFRNDGDRGGSYRGGSRGAYRGASRGNGGSSNYSPY